jgi:hypothetical protein
MACGQQASSTTNAHVNTRIRDNNLASFMNVHIVAGAIEIAWRMRLAICLASLLRVLIVI